MGRLKNTFAYVVLLCLVKVLYIYLNVLMLPEVWVRFPFDRNICLDNVLWETIPFIIGLVVYIKNLTPGHPISFVTTVFFCMYFIPSNSCLSLSGYDWLYYSSINIFNILFIYILGRNNDSIDAIFDCNNSLNGMKGNRKLDNILRYLTIMTCFGVIVYVYFLRGSLSLSGIFAEDIYETRAVVAELYAQNTDGLIAYVMTFWKSFYASMLLVGLYLALRNHHYLDIALFIFTYLEIYAFEMQKSTLFKPIIALFIYSLVKNNKLNKSDLVFLFGYTGICILGLIEYSLSKESVIYTVVLRRMTYMPQYLSHAYYEFFVNNDKLWLTHDFFQLEKIVRLFITTPYQHGAVSIISENCFPGIPSPNTGLFAEAYSQLGYLGTIVFPFIFSYIFKVYNKYSQVFGTGAAHVLLTGFFLSLINIQLLAPRGILLIIEFVLICIWVKRQINITL